MNFFEIHFFPLMKRLRISFADTSYNVPRYAAERMHRLKLLMDEHPKAEEFEFEEVDGGKFRKCLEAIVPSIETVGFTEASKPPADFSEFAQFLEPLSGNIFTLVPIICEYPIDKFTLLKNNVILCPNDWFYEFESFEHEMIKLKSTNYYGRHTDVSIRMFVSFFKEKQIITIVKEIKEITK